MMASGDVQYLYTVGRGLSERRDWGNAKAGELGETGVFFVCSQREEMTHATRNKT